MREQDIQFPANGGQGTGYLVRPDGDEPAPGVVLIQEWWGLNDHIRDIARRLASEGFVTLAPDLYHGHIALEPNDAQKQAMELDRPHAVKEIVGALTYLKAQSFVMPKKIGVTGYCMGGGLALATAAASADVGAVVAYYGGGAPQADAFATNTAPILNIVGDKDRVTPTIQKLNDDFKQYAFPHEIIIYPGADHAFFNDTRTEVHDKEAADDAWQHELAWFRRYLTNA